jgi:hypothetical protein
MGLLGEQPMPVHARLNQPFRAQGHRRTHLYMQSRQECRLKQRGGEVWLLEK